ASHPGYQIFAFIITFLIAFFVIYLLGVLLKKIVNLILLGWVDKLLGIIFGAVKGIIIVWLLLLIIVSIVPTVSPFISKSYFASRIMKLGAAVTKLRPPNIKLMPQKKKDKRKVLTNNVCKLKINPIAEYEPLKT
ncbi:MAG: CvpA family protein, partial [candidate division WOR-3 bacterium]|nr:CvpA family protein [candidate division WOR-3 bacterium]